jgi:hypothetical protein
MWAKLALLSSGGERPGGGGPGGGVAAYSLAELQADINRWPPAYYRWGVTLCGAQGSVLSASIVLDFIWGIGRGAWGAAHNKPRSARRSGQALGRTSFSEEGRAAAHACSLLSAAAPHHVTARAAADAPAPLCPLLPSARSKQSRQPLLYAVVLLLSLQLGGAVAFLARDDSARPYRLDALHMGLALQVRAGRRAGPALWCGRLRCGVLRDKANGSHAAGGPCHSRPCHAYGWGVRTGL